MDDIDKAQAAEETLRADLLARQAAKIGPKLAATGECRNTACCLPLDAPGQLFCGPACAIEHDKRIKLKGN